jgi:AbrB family looped-hinge helix DNA binding protein
MLVEATVTSKGQITLPKAIREKLALKPGQRVRFVIRGDAVLIEVAERKSVLDWYGAAKTDRKADPTEVRRQVRRAMSEESVREMSSD